MCVCVWVRGEGRSESLTSRCLVPFSIWKAAVSIEFAVLTGVGTSCRRGRRRRNGRLSLISARQRPRPTPPPRCLRPQEFWNLKFDTASEISLEIKLRDFSGNQAVVVIVLTFPWRISGQLVARLRTKQSLRNSPVIQSVPWPTARSMNRSMGLWPRSGRRSYGGTIWGSADGTVFTVHFLSDLRCTVVLVDWRGAMARSTFSL